MHGRRVVLGAGGRRPELQNLLGRAAPQDDFRKPGLAPGLEGEGDFFFVPVQIENGVVVRAVDLPALDGPHENLPALLILRKLHADICLAFFL